MASGYRETPAELLKASPRAVELDRRAFLAAASSLVLAGCAARATGLAPAGGSVASFTPVGPHSSWTGVGGSGFSDHGGGGVATPANTSTAFPRGPNTNAKPALKLWSAPSQRFKTTLNVGVNGGCFGGIAQVNAYVEGVKISNIATGVDTTPHPDGLGPKNFPGWWITLDASKFTPKLAGAALKPRVIGPYYYYVSTADADFTAHVGVGQTYATVEDALDGLKNQNAQHGLVLIHGVNVAYEIRNRAAEYGGSKSWTPVRAAPGSSAITLRRTPRPDYNAAYAGYWFTAWSLLSFEGPEITIDTRNINIIFGAGPGLPNGEPGTIRLYGVNLLNSVGAAASLDWNREMEPGGVLYQGYMECVTTRHVAGPFLGCPLVVGCNALDAPGSVFKSSGFSTWHYAHNYINGTPFPESQKNHGVMTVSYVGPQPSAKASIDSSGRCNLEAPVGNVVKSVAVTGPNTNEGFLPEVLIAHLQAWSAANGNEWVITDLEPGVVRHNTKDLWNATYHTNLWDGSLWPYNQTPGLNAKAPAVVGFATGHDYHVDIWDVTDCENVIFDGNFFVDIDFENPIKFEGNVVRDIVFQNMAFQSRGNPHTPQSYQTANGIGRCDHGIFSNFGFYAVDPGAGGFVSYSGTDGSMMVEQRQIVGYVTNAPNNWGSGAGLQDSYLQISRGSFTAAQARAAVNAAPNSGNVIDCIFEDGDTRKQTATNALIGNMVPLPGSPILAMLRPPAVKYDAYGNLRDTALGDVPGPVSRLAAPKLRPF
jgi:hypothetical protein